VSHETNGRVHVGADEALVMVRVEDAIDPRLTARVGAVYESPPQPREQAMTLVRLLIGRTEPSNGSDRWAAPIAGGRRVVTLTEEAGG
jgi:hypothetical protein